MLLLEVVQQLGIGASEHKNGDKAHPQKQECLLLNKQTETTQLTAAKLTTELNETCTTSKQHLLSCV